MTVAAAPVSAAALSLYRNAISSKEHPKHRCPYVHVCHSALRTACKRVRPRTRYRPDHTAGIVGEINTVPAIYFAHGCCVIQCRNDSPQELRT